MAKLTLIFTVLCAATAWSEARLPLGVACSTPPADHCAAGECAAKIPLAGNAVDPDTGRRFFLDYPCDWQPGDDVVFVLNIHGAGSIANWQRHYFPASDDKDKYHLVVATPTAAGSGSIGEGPAIRMWMPAEDDAHLENITRLVIAAFDAEHISSFWKVSNTK